MFGPVFEGVNGLIERPAGELTAVFGFEDGVLVSGVLGVDTEGVDVKTDEAFIAE